MSISIRAKLIELALRASNAKARTAKMFGNPTRSDKANQIPPFIARKLEFASQQIDGYALHTINCQRDLDTHIVYFHGGAYVGQATPFHWGYLKRVALRLPAKVTFAQYPLAPESTHKDTLSHALKVTEVMVNQYSDDNFYLMGDSAGGGLSLALVRNLIEKGLPQPFLKLGLISPWVDATQLDRVAPELDAKDLMLDSASLKLAAIQYAGEDSLDHPNVSPVNASFAGFPPLMIWMGSHDIFYGDMPVFIDKLQKEGIEHIYYAVEKMVHDYAILPTPEGANTIEQFAEFITK